MGGTFGATKGLLEEFGPRRVRDTPISEAGFVGAAVGAAMAGLRPVVDVMWASFTPYCFDQIVQPGRQVALHVRRPGQDPARDADGGRCRAARRGAALRHALSVVHAHPGPQGRGARHAGRGKGLLLAAIDDDNPVIFIEHMALYRERGSVPAEPTPMALGTARRRAAWR